MEQRVPRPGRIRTGEQITDLYIITMLLVFPLFPGFSGYSSITLSKFVFLLCATGVWAFALLLRVCRKKPRLSRPSPCQIAALCFLAVCCLSAVCSPDFLKSLPGAGRYDGLLSDLVYVLIFLGVSLTGRPKKLHFRAFALSMTLCLGLGLVQLTGRNPLRLYPAGLSYYDSGVRYTGVFLGTIGSTNILDAVICLSLPAFFALYVTGGGREFLLPMAVGIPLTVKAGGDGAKLALLLCAAVSMPLLLTELPRIRRWLRAAAMTLLLTGAALCWVPDPAGEELVCASVPGFFLMGLAPGLLLLSFLSLPERFRPNARALRRFFSALCGTALLAALAGIFFLDTAEGTLHELHSVLHGSVQDSFGSSRIRIWRRCLALAKERPMLGLGPGILALYADVRFSRYIPELGKEVSVFVDNAHNVYLGVLVNTGAAGLASLLTTYALAARQALRRTEEPLAASAALGAFCCAVQEFFGLGLCISEPLLWLFLGLLCSRNLILEDTYESNN